MRSLGIFSLLFLFASQVWSQDTLNPVTANTATTPVTESVKPGINDNFLGPELNLEEWIDRFEVESREVYHARKEILERLALKKGTRVADVGAGTGFYTLLMSEAVGENGWTYAIDISPRFIEHLAKLIASKGVTNATPVFCTDRSICLPPNSVDVAFICDVYHHFEYPLKTMTSIHRALSKGGRVVLIDFERIPGVSREWLLGHVRADKQTFIDEIQSVGFELIGERAIPGFRENYYLEFRRADADSAEAPSSSR